MNKEYRNHFCTMIINIIKELRTFIAFAIVILIKVTTSKAIIICGLMCGYLFIKNFLKWRTTKFTIENGMLNYNSGIVSKQRVSVPIDKITTIDLEQDLFERIFNVYKVKIDSGSLGLNKDGSEIKIVLKKKSAFVLREVLRNNTYDYDEDVIYEKISHEKEYDKVSEKPINKLTVKNKELFLSAVTGNNLAYGIGLLVAVRKGLDKIKDLLKVDIASKFSKYKHVAKFDDYSMLYIIYFILGIFILFLIVSIACSVIGTIIKYYGFSVYRKNNTIFIEYGFFNKKSYSLHVENIHAIKLKQNLIKQKFNLYRIEVATVGYGDEDSEEAILYPIANKKKLEDIIDSLIPEFKYSGGFNKAPKKAIMKYMMLPTVITILICSLLSFIKVKLSFSFILVPIVMINRYLNYKNAGIGFNDDIAVFSSKGFRKETIYIKIQSIQSISMSSNYFQRRKNLCTYNIDFHSSNLIDIVEIKHLENSYFRKLEDKIDF
ncbi:MULTISPECIES: PH domain-containing protein [Clostridium]|uniref:Bacterial membrane flanked domain family n=1 Tax=Clostridium novyi (strain NT) TaxID=386415 RepID=A0PYF4_CLONN|nr:MULTISPECIES: PH domain-containing protein [Clostridium]ABK60786.1 Bacterial membrane flanked domain family [Clostridium novyi NT]KEH86697.1 membrane protein [Clostridium novyi A str. NCTC 538]KEH89075.1 membrane protein [Clostridium novyi A str. 4540]KEH93000.1 membrane protein [Clostridium botulinum C/D str. It1]KEH95873.1 membrane protein [Clostridium novyi A str. GD211209]